MNPLLLALTVLSLLVAVAASWVAWRAVTENRRRSDARVALLADAIRADEPPDSEPVALTHLLDDPQPERRRQRLTVLATAGTLLVLLMALGRVAGGGAERASAEPHGAATAPVQHDGLPPASVDLVALTHELSGGGQLELRGEVRNASGDANMEHVNVVALLFDQQGAYLSSSRAPLQAQATTGGGSAATFFVTVPDGGRVGRYRVSFRAGERVVPHVDRRQAR